MSDWRCHVKFCVEVECDMLWLLVLYETFIEDSGMLECDTVSLREWSLMYQSKVVVSSSRVKPCSRLCSVSHPLYRFLNPVPCNGHFTVYLHLLFILHLVLALSKLHVSCREVYCLQTVSYHLFSFHLWFHYHIPYFTSSEAIIPVVGHWSVVTPSLYIWQHPSSGSQLTAWSLVHLPDGLAIFSGWPLTDHTIHIYLLHLFFVGYSSCSTLTLEGADTVFLKNVGKQWPSGTVTHPRRLESSFVFLFSITNNDTLKHYSCVWKTECVQSILQGCW